MRWSDTYGTAYSIGFRRWDPPTLPWWTKLWQRIFPPRFSEIERHD